jgi:uncharacterized protein YjbK
MTNELEVKVFDPNTSSISEALGINANRYKELSKLYSHERIDHDTVCDLIHAISIKCSHINEFALLMTL